jgi:hypothetical protein
VSCSANTTLTFLVFWLVFKSKMKSYSCGGDCVYYRAPIYLAAVVLGMFALIFAKPLAVLLGMERTEQDTAKLEAVSSSEKEPLILSASASAVNDGNVGVTAARKANAATEYSKCVATPTDVICSYPSNVSASTLTNDHSRIAHLSGQRIDNPSTPHCRSQRALRSRKVCFFGRAPLF